MSVDQANGVHCFMIYGLYDDYNMNALQRYLLDSVDILSYWNHLPMLYLVKTKLSTSELTQKLMPFFHKKLFLLAEIDQETVNGSLPPQAWNWFRVPAPPQKPSMPTAASLAALFASKD